MASTSLAAHDGASSSEQRERRKVGDKDGALAPQPQEFAERVEAVPAKHAAAHPLELQYWLSGEFKEQFARSFPKYKLQWERNKVHLVRANTSDWDCCGPFLTDCINCITFCDAPGDRAPLPSEDKFVITFSRDGTGLLEDEGFHEARVINQVSKQLDALMKKWRAEHPLGARLAEAPLAVAVAQNGPWRCPACTLDNHASVVACSACGTRRPAQ